MNSRKEEIARIISRYMDVHGISQAEMARRLGVTSPVVSGWLDPNKYGITRKNALRVRTVCSDVITEDDFKEPPQPPPQAENTPVDIDRYITNVMGAVMRNDRIPDELKILFCNMLRASAERG